MTKPDNDASLSELEREAERNRARLTSTVGALQERVRPAAIKADVKEYIQGRGDELYRNIERSARENPMRTVAIAAGLAYPLWRIFSSIPVPILFVGAGLALANKSSGEPSAAATKVGEVAARIQDRIGQQADVLSDKLDATTDRMTGIARDVGDRLSEAKQQIGATVSSGADQLASQASKLSSEASKIANETAERAKDFAGSARQMGSDALTAATAKASSAYQAGAEAVSRTGEQVSEAAVRSKDRVLETIENHPIVVGVLGLAIGALVASALPATRIENRVLGAGSDELKAKAGTVAAQAIDAAKSVAGEVYSDAAAAAEQHGLTPDALRETAKDIGDKVSSAANRAFRGTASADRHVVGSELKTDS